MKNKARNRFIFLLVVILILTLLGFWYKVTYSMEVVESKEMNSAQLSTKILIATQGSTFKDAVVQNVTSQYELDSVYIKVIDVFRLSQINETDFKAIVILHTWEYGKPPQTVEDFVTNYKGTKDKLIVLTTSGEGTNELKGIDALAGESILEDASDYTDEIIERIELLIR